MLTFAIETGILQDPQGRIVFADRPYQYSITGKKGGGAPVTDPELTRRRVSVGPEGASITGLFPNLEIEVRQALRTCEGGIERDSDHSKRRVIAGLHR